MSPSSFQTAARRQSAADRYPLVHCGISAEAQFGLWLERELEKLEERFRDFTTPDSLKRCLRADRK
jgi:hypothetical protein